MRKTGFYLLPTIVWGLLVVILRGLIICILWIIDLVSCLLMLVVQVIRAILVNLARFFAWIYKLLYRFSDCLEEIIGIQVDKNGRE